MFHDRDQLDSFQFLLQSQMQAKSFVNDTNSTQLHPAHNRSGCVMTILRSDFPGYTSVEEITERSIRNRYLVLRLLIHDAPVYIHNVYAPVKAEERVLFFSNCTPTISIQPSTHLVLGDFNTPLNPAVDASSGAIRHESSRLACLEWLSQIGVDHLPRKKRVDHICMSEQLFSMVYKDSEYFRPRHAGDYLAQKVNFANLTQSPGRGYWKCSPRLFEYSQVVEEIKMEAILLLEQVRTTFNAGKMWESRKRKMKKQLQATEKKIAQDSRRDVESTQRVLESAAAQYREKDTPESRYFFESSLQQFRSSVEITARYNQDESFDHHVKDMESFSRYFFGPPDSSCRRVPIENVTKKCGTVTSNPREVVEEFTGFD
uniref:AlNc14C81G5293 protein n=1 Tax=Albugo laibachii Nc14 TaxID=890382 RepID=F0WFA1_9STRA|nr:AlNc14C81G5293 [Albugo laibachii Nc14]|eukprot:CCA19883.1 AlNc14C81G5293 [Albugo laibachii Nc14]